MTAANLLYRAERGKAGKRDEFPPVSCDPLLYEPVRWWDEAEIFMPTLDADTMKNAYAKQKYFFLWEIFLKLKLHRGSACISMSDERFPQNCFMFFFYVLLHPRIFVKH